MSCVEQFISSFFFSSVIQFPQQSYSMNNAQYYLLLSSLRQFSLFFKMYSVLILICDDASSKYHSLTSELCMVVIQHATITNSLIYEYIYLVDLKEGWTYTHRDKLHCIVSFFFSSSLLCIWIGIVLFGTTS